MREISAVQGSLVGQEVPRLEAKVRRYQGQNGRGGGSELLGFAELVIAGAFVIRDIRILRTKSGDGEGRLFVGFPSKKGGGASGGKYFDIAHPITAQAREKASEAILGAWREVAGGMMDMLG